MSELTQIQQATLDYIRNFILRNGIAPTLSEIASGMGWKSPNTAQFHVHTLRIKGHLKRVKGTSRGLVLSERENNKLCHWSYHDDPDYHWSGTCGMAWQFLDGGPVENKFSFCPKCGNPIVVQKSGEKP